MLKQRPPLPSPFLPSPHTRTSGHDVDEVGPKVLQEVAQVHVEGGGLQRGGGGGGHRQAQLVTRRGKRRGRCDDTTWESMQAWRQTSALRRAPLHIQFNPHTYINNLHLPITVSPATAH